MDAKKRAPRRWAISVGVLAVIVALAVGGVVGVGLWHRRGDAPVLAGERLRSFPDVDRSGFDETQGRIVDVLAGEFDAQHDGTKYSEGVDEPWCADFVSWVMREAGRPLANPNSGSWRIPGVYTLEDYYRGQQRFEAANYLPKAGDVVMYSETSAFQQHTNIVIAADPAAGTITTVGGNEFGQITIHRYNPSLISGLVGYGRL
ncbi:CHAP domain-containing protein [Nocardia yamanashiensis]|uniref:CHAP domain-containing protein n=1 Tax=Nocardia yamanashiensis TaxID=209247 RepID=UPI0008296705|nr:CHAP domain-containing protein [Nocardia yamanashiensis]